MFAFAAVLVLGAFALASCGGDDDDDPVVPTPTPSEEGYSYQFTVEVNKDTYESMKALYPDLAITYTIPGMDAKTVALTSEPITIKENSSTDGRVTVVFNGKLDTSKVDPAKKYSFDVAILYDVDASTKRLGILNPYFTGTGQQIIEMYSDLSTADDLSKDF